MQYTRRCWAIILLVGSMAGMALLVRRSILLVGTAVLGGWVLSQQYHFIHSIDATLDDLSIIQSVSRTTVTAEDTIVATLVAETTEDTHRDLVIEPTPPVGATGATASDWRLELPDGDDHAETRVEFAWPIAGQHQFDSPTVTITDRHRLFKTTVQHGPTASVTVRPRAPDNVHIGTGGEQLAAVFGEHATDAPGSGTEPAELREYHPGDSMRQIDWNATARLNHPHVREYESETDRRTLLFVDHRSSVTKGPDGATKLDYLRQVALGFVNSTSDFNDPLGLYTIDDDGVITRHDPAATTSHYRRLQHRLYDLQVPSGQARTGDPRSQLQIQTGATTARRGAAQLDPDSDQFAATLTPYLTAGTAYLERIDDQPLFTMIESAITSQRGTLWSVICTDDQHRAELREAVRLARQHNNHVLVFITPSVLFDTTELADLETAYQTYRDFENFRRSLSRYARVTAFEVGPGDRLEAILAAGNRRGQSEAHS